MVTEIFRRMLSGAITKHHHFIADAMGTFYIVRAPTNRSSRSECLMNVKSQQNTYLRGIAKRCVPARFVNLLAFSAPL